MSSKERLGWGPFFEEQVAHAPRANLSFARIVEEQRGAYRVAGDVEGWAEVSGRFRHEATCAADFPSVGDWVGISRSFSRSIIEWRLQRRSTVARAAAGIATDEQVLAANVDTIFLVTAMTRDLNPHRLERYLTLVWEAGAVPVIVLSKSDLSADPEAECDRIRSRIPFVDVIAVSAMDDDGLAALMPYLRPAHTIALLGSSGVGKSTLINRLLGRDTLRVNGLDANGKGRHTTTARQLVELDGGALLIDTPGMRELQPWADERAIDGAFDDIATIAERCRFADCTHANEPGCAVREAIDAGALDPDRLEHYRRLLREVAFQHRKRDKAAAAELKRKWKQLTRAAKALYRNRDRS